jgi:hypothetical protein
MEIRGFMKNARNSTSICKKLRRLRAFYKFFSWLVVIIIIGSLGISAAGFMGLGIIVGSVTVFLADIVLVLFKCPHCNQPVMRKKVMHTFLYTPIMPKQCCNCFGSLRISEDMQCGGREKKRGRND